MVEDLSSVSNLVDMREMEGVQPSCTTHPNKVTEKRFQNTPCKIAFTVQQLFNILRNKRHVYMYCWKLYFVNFCLVLVHDLALKLRKEILGDLCK